MFKIILSASLKTRIIYNTIINAYYSKVSHDLRDKIFIGKPTIIFKKHL